jgi:uncharacterized LabA/DUF88 family protein
VERVIAYVDGFNLYFGLKSKGWRRFYWLDIPKLARSLLKPNQQLVEAKYFTSRVSASPSDPDKPKRQNAYLEALLTFPGLSIFYGHYLTDYQTCRNCGATWYKPSEKMTDVNIATELLTDAFQDHFDASLLISGDSDLTAPIRTIRRLFPKKWVVVASPPNRHSVQLANAASTHFTIGRGKISASQLPDRVTKPDGFVLHRPAKWI